jgi:hypothetical protein
VSFLIVRSSALSSASRRLLADLCSAALVSLLQVFDRFVDALDSLPETLGSEPPVATEHVLEILDLLLEVRDIDVLRLY